MTDNGDGSTTQVDLQKAIRDWWLTGVGPHLIQPKHALSRSRLISPANTVCAPTWQIDTLACVGRTILLIWRRGKHQLLQKSAGLRRLLGLVMRLCGSGGGEGPLLMQLPRRGTSLGQDD